MTKHSIINLIKNIYIAFLFLFKRWAISLLSLLALFSIAMLLVARYENQKSLIKEGEWISSGGYEFLRMQPDKLNSFISEGLISKGTFLYVNQRGPDWKTFSGEIASPPFAPTKYMVVPIKGLIYSVDGHGPRTFNPDGGKVILRCLENNKTMDLLLSPSQDWFEHAIVTPDNWCGGLAQIIAKADDPDIFIGVGTPYSVSAGYALLAGRCNLIVSFGIATIFFFLLFVPPLLLSNIHYLARGACSLVSIGLFGYVSYVLQAKNIPNAVAISISVALLLIPSLTLILQKKIHQDVAISKPLSNISVAWLILGCFIVLPLLLMPFDSGAWTFNFAYYPVAWSTDNLLPTGMARYVLETTAIQPPGMGPWSVTDRGFTPAGIIAGVLYVLDLYSLGSRSPSIYFIAQIMITLVNASIILLILQFPRFRDIASIEVAKISCLICATPFFFFNSVYSWPKMMAGIYIFWGILLLSETLKSKKLQYAYLVAPLMVFGILSHSASIFCIPAILAYGVIALIRSNVNLDKKYLALAFFSCFLSTIAWLYHDSYGAKSSFGLTFVFTGSGIFGLTNAEILQLVKKQISGMSLHSFGLLKLEQLSTLVWPPFKQIFYETDFMSRFRLAQLHSFLPSLLYFAPISIVLYTLNVKVTSVTGDIEGIKNISVALLLGALTTALLLFISSLPFIVAHFPYAFGISIMAYSVLIANFRSRLITALIFIHVLLFLIVWVVGPLQFWTFKEFSAIP